MSDSSLKHYLAWHIASTVRQDAQKLNSQLFFFITMWVFFHEMNNSSKMFFNNFTSVLVHAVPRVQGLKVSLQLALKQKSSLTLISSVHVTSRCPLSFWLEKSITYYLWQFFRNHKQGIYSKPVP